MHPKQILNEIGHFPKRGFSQNFFYDANLREKIIALLPKGVPVWEVGPGLGFFTERLLELGVPVTAFEIDRRLGEFLQKRFPNLDLKITDFLEETPPPPPGLAIFSNLPFHISSPFLFKLLEFKNLGSATVVFQKDYVSRLIAKPRTKDYGILSVLIQDAFEISLGPVLPAQVFYPKPGVASQTIQLLPKNRTPQLAQIVRPAFSHRRKKLHSNLLQSFAPERVAKMFETLQLSQNARAEELSVMQYCKALQILKEHAQ